MIDNREILVFSERPDLLAELIAGGRQLAEQAGASVVALVLGPRAAGEQAIKRGADKVLWLGEVGENLPEDYVDTIAGLVRDREPVCLLLGATTRGKVVA